MSEERDTGKSENPIKLDISKQELVYIVDQITASGDGDANRENISEWLFNRGIILGSTFKTACRFMIKRCLNEGLLGKGENGGVNLTEAGSVYLQREIETCKRLKEREEMILGLKEAYDCIGDPGRPYYHQIPARLPSDPSDIGMSISRLIENLQWGTDLGI